MPTSSSPEFEDALVGEIIDEPASSRTVDAKDVKDVIDRIRASTEGGQWQLDVQLDLGSRRWRPSAVTADRRHLLYVYLQEDLPPFVIERLRLARLSNISVTVALPLASLCKPHVVELLVDLEAEVLVIDDYIASRRLIPRPVLLALVEVEVSISPELRRSICRSAWSRIDEGSAQQRGRRLEAILAFLFSQVGDLKVIEHNYRTETEEIDLVLQIDNFSPRVWQQSGRPFILVEAKNRAEKASQQVMSVLLTKLQTKRGTSHIAFLVSLAGFTEDARVQELRFSTQNICVVMIDRSALESLMDAEDLDAALETFVRHALLR